MSAENLRIHDRSDPGLWLQTVTWEEQETLRAWKNAHRVYFFHQAEILGAQQSEWFRGYLGRKDDYLFTVVHDQVPVGCMGIRLLEEGWDVYNVIRGDPLSAGRGLMSRALSLMLRFARSRQDRPIALKVLKDNPAVAWYVRNGFVTAGEGPNYYSQRFQPTEVDYHPVSIETKP